MVKYQPFSDGLAVRYQDKDAYSAFLLTNAVGTRVILIERLTNEDRFGILVGVIVKSDQKDVLCVREARTNKVYRFPAGSSKEGSDDQYFLLWNLWRHFRYNTRLSRELREATSKLYNLALRAEIILPQDREKLVVASNRELRQYISTRLSMPSDSTYDEIVDTIKG